MKSEISDINPNLKIKKNGGEGGANPQHMKSSATRQKVFVFG